MPKKMKALIQAISILFISIPNYETLLAQPGNDDCSGAYNVIISDSEANVVLTEGDTRGATKSNIPKVVCSTAWYNDDIFFKFTTPAVIDSTGIVIRAYFDNSIIPTDVIAIGMALYDSCDSLEDPSHCFSSNAPEDDRFEFSGICLLADHTYILRVWSTGGDSTTEGTLRIGIYPNRPIEPYLWWETFGGGLEINGWTTYGMCSAGVLDTNAGFKYLPDCLIDRGCYAQPGYRVSGASYCDGAVGVDSDYNDCCNDFCQGPCPTPGHHILISPALYSGDWNVPGLTLTWTQAIRQYQSIFYISFRTRDIGDDWTDWTDIEINTEFPINSNFFGNNVQRHFMPNAAGHDSIQIRFIYNDNYYLWAIDDVIIVPTECNNMRIDPTYYAIAPFAQIPHDQVYPFAGLADIQNVGACDQTNVVLNLAIQNTETEEIVFSDNFQYGLISPDTLAKHAFFSKMIEFPTYIAGYLATYSLTQDSVDYNPLDNYITFPFTIGGDIFGLEDGFTRSVSVNSALYSFGAPLSYAYGNYFRPVHDAQVGDIIWGVNNPKDMTGKTISIYLIKWTDSNVNQISEFNERSYVGYSDYTFSGNEGDNVLLRTELENFNNPGEPVIMKEGNGYMTIIEYVASTATDPQLFLLASEARDYRAEQLAMDSAVAKGLALNPVYFSVLGFSSDGNISNVDYEVKELDVNDNRLFFGNNIVPVIRIEIVYPDTMKTNDELPDNNLVTVYPNPALIEMLVKMEFAQAYQNVQLRLINNLGQTVFKKTFSNTIKSHIEPINVSSLAPGNYLLQVETPAGQRTLPVIIVH